MNRDTGQLLMTNPRVIPNSRPLYRRQQGAVLFVSLMMMLLLTIIGVTAMNNVTLEERMAGNLRDDNLAFQAAEAALRNAEALLAANNTPPNVCTTDPCSSVWDRDTLPNLATQDQAFWVQNGIVGNGDITGLDSDPIFIIEELSFANDHLGIGREEQTGEDYYKITARAVGGSQSAISILSTTFAQRYD